MKAAELIWFHFLFLFSFRRLEKLGALEWTKVVHKHQGWRLITCIWLHAGVIHLLTNMLCLVFIGIRLEQQFGFGMLLCSSFMCWKLEIIQFKLYTLLFLSFAPVIIFVIVLLFWHILFPFVSADWNNLPGFWLWWECPFLSIHTK